MRISDWSSDVCSSDLLEAPAAFRVFRDNHVSSKDALNARRPHMEALFAKLGKAGIARDSLYLAWDFTVASERKIGRATCRATSVSGRVDIGGRRSIKKKTDRL